MSVSDEQLLYFGKEQRECHSSFVLNSFSVVLFCVCRFFNLFVLLLQNATVSLLLACAAAVG